MIFIHKDIFLNELENSPHKKASGVLSEKIIREILMTASINDYIQVLIHRIQGDENVWTDVEGMGYGWLWLNKEEHNWHKMLFNHIKQVLSYINLYENNTQFIKVVENNLTKYYITDRKNNFRDIEITLSNTELYY